MGCSLLFPFYIYYNEGVKKDKKIFIVGHKNPDTDSICSAIAYADYLRKKGKKAIAVRAGKINPETKFVLDYFKGRVPEFLADAKKKKVILLDHNEKEQSPNNVEKAEILEVIDHHKIAFEYSSPIFFRAEPLGATSTILAGKYFNDKKVKMTKQIAGLLLSAILSDTVVFKSSTTTKEDVEIAKKLAKIAKIKNLEKFGIEIKKKKVTLKGLGAKAIIYSDFKIYNFSKKKVGIGQVEVCGFKEVNEKKEELIKKLEEISKKEKYNLLILMATNIFKKGSLLLAWGKINYLEKAFGKRVTNNSIYLRGVMSRKKEILPPLMKTFSK